MANLTFKVKSAWTGEGLGVKLKARQHRLLTDEPPELGGTDRGRNPVEWVLDAREQALWARADATAVMPPSDRGRHCLSIRYSERLAEGGAVPSVSNIGDS